MERLLTFIRTHKVLVLSGAGCSTKSGIPDYRGATTGRPPANPIAHSAFMRSAFVRRRYWARSCLGWPRFAAAGPNDTHLSCARLEQLGRAVGIVSQNVDGLHQAAGSRAVVELHGCLAQVTCLSCGATMSRQNVQTVMLKDNPGWLAFVAQTAPDGDVDLPDALVEDFAPPQCSCGGGLMPNVIFFGGFVRPAVLQSAWDLFAQADGLLVVGTSLTVFSGYRFARKAADLGMPIAIVNQGPTRADGLAAVQLDAECGETLRAVVDALP